MKKHTPEPWMVTNSTDVFPVGDTKARKHIADCDTSIAPLKNDGTNDMTDLDYAETKANARRIVAAVNACEGISTEALEAGAVRDLVAVVEELLESAAYWSEYDVPLGIVDRIKAAIENAKRGGGA